MSSIISPNFLNNIELLELRVKDNVAGLFGGTHRSKTFGSSCEFADYKEYMQGDDVKKIDWRAFARFDKLFIKQYLDERQMHTRIYIDTSLSMSYEKKNEYALKIAAVLSYLSVKAMDKVSIYSIDGHKCQEIISKMVGKDNYMNNISQLNKVAFDGESFISDAILTSNVGYGDGVSIIISDFLTDNDYKKAIDYLRSKRRDVICIQVLSDNEINPKFNARMLFFDSENRKSTFRKNINREVIAAYKRALDFVTHDISHYCSSRNASYFLLNADSKVEDFVFRNAMKKGVIR